MGRGVGSVFRRECHICQVGDLQSSFGNFFTIEAFTVYHFNFNHKHIMCKKPMFRCLWITHTNTVNRVYIRLKLVSVVIDNICSLRILVRFSIFGDSLKGLVSAGSDCK